MQSKGGLMLYSIFFPSFSCPGLNFMVDFHYILFSKCNSEKEHRQKENRKKVQPFEFQKIQDAENNVRDIAYSGTDRKGYENLDFRSEPVPGVKHIESSRPSDNVASD
jgi:hypothetical protein